MPISGGNLKKDKIIIQIIFCLGQIGVFFTWFGTPDINTCRGIETILILNYLYPLCVVLFEYLLWERWRPKLLIGVYGVLFLDAVLAIYIWWKRYSFFIGDIPFELRYILPGYYAYLAMMAAAFVVTAVYIRKTVNTIETVEDKLAEQNTDVIAGLEQGKKMLLERLEQAATADEREKIQNLIDGYDKMIAEYTVYKNNETKSQKITAGIIVSDRMANLLAAAVLYNRVIDYPVSALLLQP